MPPPQLRAALHAAADIVADYLEDVEDYAVLPPVRPGQLTDLLGGPPPEDPQPLEDIVRDLRAHVDPQRDPLAEPVRHGLLLVERISHRLVR